MPTASDKGGVRRSLGTASQVRDSVPDLAAGTSRLRALLCKDDQQAWVANLTKEGNTDAEGRYYKCVKPHVYLRVCA